MSLLRYRPFRNKLVEGIARVGEGDAINFVDLIGHQQNAMGSRSALESCAEGKGGRRATSRPHEPDPKASRAWAIRMPILRRITLAVITVSMVNPVPSWKVRTPRTAQSKSFVGQRKLPPP